MIQRPPKYYEPTRLKDLLIEDNPTFKSLSMNILLSTAPFAKYGKLIYDKFDPYHLYLMYNLLNKYYYSESGFDIDEIFIDRFSNRWNCLAPIYEGKLKIFADIKILKLEETGDWRFTINMSEIYSRKLNITTKLDGTITKEKGTSDIHDLTYDKGVTQTTTNDLTDTSDGNDTEYQAVTKDIHGKTKRTGTVDITSSGADTTKGSISHSGSDTDTTDTTKTVTNNDTVYDVEKLKILGEVDNIVKDFTLEFENLFMGVFNYL